ncbi:MAG TPA: DUF72 domain-containing protein [Gemmatimonadales bacterium]|nr:DUF72 domain-containing protein [Gemmatimonadales bacterium]
MFLVGTSGWSFKEWKGSFYPKDLSDDRMLEFYGARFPTVEVNNTFYRMPRESTLLEWAARVPPSFRFAIKASQRITHQGRLGDVSGEVEYFTRVTSELGPLRGPTLFQLPPNLKKDLPRLTAFLGLLPRRWQAAFEFRHESWFEDAVYDALRARDAALVIADHDDFATPVLATASWGYARLHRQGYDEAALTDWAGRLRGLGLSELYVFFKHDEVQGSGPEGAEAFSRLVAATTG